MSDPDFRDVEREREDRLAEEAGERLGGGEEVVLRTKTGRVLTDEEIQALADEAERGYDPADFVPRPAPLEPD